MKLSQAFGITAADVDVNRKGLLTPEQKKMLEDTRKIRGCGMRAVILALGASILAIVLIFVFSVDTSSPEFWQVLTCYALTIIIFTGLSLAFLMWGYVHSRDLEMGRISVVEGKARLSSKDFGQAGTAYYVRIGRVRFQLAIQRHFAAFKQGASYRVFYVKDPPAHIILSIEALKG